jgi:hypothetical protein
MSENKDNKKSEKPKKDSEKGGTFNRRDILKGLATIPVFGPFLYAFFRKKWLDDLRKKEILAELGMNGEAPAVPPKAILKKSGELIRLGIIGFGGRGEALAHAAGFAHPDMSGKTSWIKGWRLF